MRLPYIEAHENVLFRKKQVPDAAARYPNLLCPKRLNGRRHSPCADKSGGAETFAKQKGQSAATSPAKQNTRSDCLIE